MACIIYRIDYNQKYYICTYINYVKENFRYLMTKDFHSSLRTNYKMNKLLSIFLDVSEITLNIYHCFELGIIY